MVTKDSKDVPYHMRDDSDDEANPPPEYEDPQGESQSGHGDRDAKEKKEKSGLKGLFGRKTKVGTVKVDPGIGTSLARLRREARESHKSWSECKLMVRLRRLVRRGSRPGLPRQGR